jgi:hypothetical protein
VRNPRFWRELFLRATMPLVLAAIAVLFLDVDPWIWLVPAGVVLLIVLKWTTGAPYHDDDGTDGQASSADNSTADRPASDDDR